jgi:hypothetical protein
MRHLLSILQKFIPKQPIKPVGRWSNEYCDVKTSQKVDLSNEDHCGPCGQYALSKQEVKENTPLIYGREPFRKVFPNCAECIYYDKKQIDSYSRCKKFEYTNSITDKIEYEYADYARRSESMCGHDGKHYICIPVIRHEK